jgi:Integrase core domain
VDRFNIDIQSPKPDCMACTEAKQHIKPFPKMSKWSTKPGELTHIDLWGKCMIKSIKGNQYYLLFVDDTKRFITIQCLKEKLDSTQSVINYLTHLIVQNWKPKGIQIHCRKEFMNDKLENWCKEHGIEIRLTAPYSPSQNGIAECMNQTLVELSWAMLHSNQLPEFLWEYAITHAAYLHNRSFKKHLPKLTPYQGWYSKKPTVAHLREFGSPVWVLLQGMNKNYNAETHKVLTSWNFQIITPPEKPSPTEHIDVTPDLPCEGESVGDMLSKGVTTADEITDEITQKFEPWRSINKMK